MKNLVAHLMPGSFIGNCVYTFTREANFSQARSECQSYGGDLIYKNFGPTGAAYHEYDFLNNCLQ